jgi:hypothetical protein
VEKLLCGPESSLVVRFHDEWRAVLFQNRTECRLDRLSVPGRDRDGGHLVVGAEVVDDEDAGMDAVDRGMREGEVHGPDPPRAVPIEFVTDVAAAANAAIPSGQVGDLSSCDFGEQGPEHAEATERPESSEAGDEKVARRDVGSTWRAPPELRPQLVHTPTVLPSLERRHGQTEESGGFIASQASSSQKTLKGDDSFLDASFHQSFFHLPA